jgi:Uma2 family endonuclease
MRVPSPNSGFVVSPEAFWDLCVANPDLRLTRTARGELIVMAPAGSDSGGRNSDLSGQLWAWNRANRLGRTFDSSAGFTLPNGFVHAPDASWIVQQRWDSVPRDLQRKFAPICPDFVAELMSPSDRRADVVERLEEFMAQGARLGWLIDPKSGDVEIHHSGRPVEVLKMPPTLSGEDVLPGFVLDLKGILFD